VGGKGGGVDGEEVWRLLGLGALVVVEDACVRDCRVLGVCTVGTIGYSVGDKCEGRRADMVTGWRKRGGGKDRGRE
jgi:hypothetical protein